MAILTIRNLGLSFGARDIFSGISATLNPGTRVGLVGPNGVGKTSLFRIIAGLIPPTSGSVQLGRDTTIGYLRQEAVDAFAQRHHSVWTEMRTAFTHLDDVAQCMRVMEARMAAGDHGEELLHAYGAAEERFAHGGGYEIEGRIRRTLEGLGFDEANWSLSLDQLSGGQKTRALLARLLLESPSLLILDEPTNHLDIEATSWLEQTLRAWEGTVLVASHDRYFLDRVADRIWDMHHGQIDEYRGNYTAYTQQRHERWERNREVYDREMERLRSDLEVVERYIAWRKYDEAWGRLKRLGRELMAIEEHGLVGVQGKSWGEMGLRSARIMEVSEARQRINAIPPPPGKPPEIHVHLKADRRHGQMVLRAHDLAVGYNGVALVQADDLEVERTERVAIIGPNGAGKTTLLRTLLGELPPVTGKVEISTLYKVGYFAQAHEALDPESTVIDALMDDRLTNLAEARNYLARYLFRGDDVWKPVKALSGGERARLALAILALEHVDLLLLDEPTNHLDIPAQEVLEEGLAGYEGTLLLVSHDRYLIDALATQIWEIHDGRLEVFNGTYAEMVAAKEAQQAVAAPVPSRKRGRKHAAVAVAPGPEQRLATLEVEIARAEEALATCERLLDESGEAGDVPRLIELSKSYEETKSALDRLMEEWMTLAERRA